MNTTASFIQCGIHAGLELTEVNKKAKFFGTTLEWSQFNADMMWVEENGSYPWVMPF